MFSPAWKLCKTKELHKENSLFWGKYYRNEGHKPETAQSSSLGEHVKLREFFVCC
jgi:hypothetical protein